MTNPTESQLPPGQDDNAGENIVQAAKKAPVLVAVESANWLPVPRLTDGAIDVENLARDPANADKFHYGDYPPVERAEVVRAVTAYQAANREPDRSPVSIDRSPEAKAQRGNIARLAAGHTGNELEVIAQIKPSDLERPSAGKKFELIAGFDGFDYAENWTVKGLIPAESLCCIYGPSGSFKSFAAVSLACHIATGKEWDGRKVEQGAVLYVAAEGGQAVSRRVMAWAMQYNDGANVPNMVRINEAVRVMTSDHLIGLIDSAKLVEAMTGEKVKMIVIDTVARCLEGDENRAETMNAFIYACDLVKQATGAAVVLVHHTGKDETKGARGSSSLRAALDAELFIARESATGQAFTLVCTKMKEAEQQERRAYDLRSHVVCQDSDGDDVTSLVVVATGREPADPEALGDAPNLSKNHKAMFKTIKALCEELDGSAPWQLVIDKMKASKTWNGQNGSRWREKLVADDLITWDYKGQIVTLLERPDE
ncbi:helicase RepA family protein [Aeromonas rivipollensis]